MLFFRCTTQGCEYETFFFFCLRYLRPVLYFSQLLHHLEILLVIVSSFCCTCVWGGTLTDSDGSLGKMQLGISWAEHASTSVFVFIRVHNQEFAFNTVWAFRWKSEIERMLLEACFPLHITGCGKGLAFWGSPVLRGETFSCWSPWWSETQTRMWGLMRDWACSQVSICRHVWVCCVYQLCGGSTIKETEQEH